MLLVMPNTHETQVAWSSKPPLNRKRKNFKWIYDSFLEYTRYSSMHGLRYIGEKERHPIERLFWLGAFLLAVACSAYFITNLFNNFNEMPVIMSLSPTTSIVSDIPFPAITICNMNNMRKTKAQEVIDKYETAKKNNYKSSEIYLDYKLMYDFCSREPEEEIEYTVKNSTSNFDTIKKFLIKMTQPCHEMLVQCLWHGQDMPCDELFNPSLTDEGICCVFNRLKRDQIFRDPRDLTDLNVTYPQDIYFWTPEKGYPSGLPFDTLPRRPKGSGTHLGLKIIVDAELDQYYCSSENSEGFKILMNTPLETPKVQSFAISIPPSFESKVVIVPQLRSATPQLENIDIEKRQCYFESEKHLHFFRTYNQKSCVFECEANFTLYRCGCVLHFMPKNATTRICGRSDTACAKEAQNLMDESMNNGDLINATNALRQELKMHQCDCRPGCHEVSYNFVVSSSPISPNLQMKAGAYQDDRNDSYYRRNMAIIHFYYKDRQFSGTIRGVLYGFTEFLSSTGGLLGLFLGFSFLSLVEIVFYVATKLFEAALRTEEPKLQESISSQMPTFKAGSNINDQEIIGKVYPYMK